MHDRLVSRRIDALHQCFLVSSGVLFHIIVPEYEILFLNRLMFDFGIISFCWIQIGSRIISISVSYLKQIK